MKYVIISVFLAATLTAQQATIRSDTQEVLLDLVVRDKKGKPVRDLKPDEIIITDEGTEQKINAFRLVDPQTETPTQGDKASVVTQLDPNRQVRLVTLVFDRINGPDARRLSKQAAMDLLNAGKEPNLYFAVFSIDQRLSVLQPFTADRELLKKAVDRATSGNYASFNSLSDEIQKQLEASTSAGSTLSSTSASGPGGGGAIGAAAAEAKMAEMQLNMLRFADVASREQQGRASIFGLLALVKEQHVLPGRKTVMYFSEGMVVPSGLVDQFRIAIGSANRANVSVYAIDARGLTGGSGNSDATGMLGDAANSSMRQQMAARSGQQAPVTKDQVEIFDRAADSLTANRQNNLAELAEGTGGFLIANTNDIRGPLRQVSEDIRSYYAVAYSPKIEELDGRFRKIAVRITRPDVKVQARSGYFALPMVAGQSLMPYEVPMLKAFNAPTLPKAFTFRSAGLHFDARQDRTKCAFAIEVPLANLTFEEDKESKIFHGHVSAMALIKNGQGAVVEKLSRDVPFRVPPDKLEQTKMGNFITTFHTDLPPGRYTIETAVLDRENMAVSAKKSILVVPGPPQGIAMSSLSLIRRVDPQAEKTPGDPFHFSGGRVTPSLVDQIPSGQGATLSMYFVIYPNKTIPDPPKLAIQFLKDGKVVGQAQPDLPAPNAEGIIPYVATSSAETMPAGQYEIRVVAMQGNTRAEEHSFFTVQ